MQLTGSQIVIECLKEQGVDTVFGYPGGAILNVYDELYKHKNEITSIENVIVKENNYSNVKYFDRYNSDKSYYIIRATKGKKQQYAVFDEKYKLIKSYSGDVVDQQVCINAFKEKYKQEPSEVSVGYENEIFVYCLMYQGKDSLVYAFYGIDNGEFVKAYRIDNG